MTLAVKKAAFYFAVNVRAVLAASNKTVSDLALVSGIHLHKLALILNTDADENAPLRLNTAANIILPALRSLVRLNNWITFEDFCFRDLSKDGVLLPLLSEKNMRLDSSV